MKTHEYVGVLALGFLILLVWNPPSSNRIDEGVEPIPVEESLEKEAMPLHAPQVQRMARQEILLEDVKGQSESSFTWLFQSNKPYKLFDEETFLGNLPTEDNFHKFCNQRGLEPNEESFVKFERILEIDAFKSFILGYRLRELRRFENRQASRTLTQELDPILGYIHNLVIDEYEFWSAVDAYEREIVADTEQMLYLPIGVSENERRITALLQEKIGEILQ